MQPPEGSAGWAEGLGCLQLIKAPDPGELLPSSGRGRRPANPGDRQVSTHARDSRGQAGPLHNLWGSMQNENGGTLVKNYEKFQGGVRALNQE